MWSCDGQAAFAERHQIIDVSVAVRRVKELEKPCVVCGEMCPLQCLRKQNCLATTTTTNDSSLEDCCCGGISK